MYPTEFTSQGVRIFAIIATMPFVALGIFAPATLGEWEHFLVLGMMLLLGLPHGATDHGLFDALIRKNSLTITRNFYLTYLLVIGGYGLVWYLLPGVAFLLFLVLSVYHFGQSNWVDVSYPHPLQARLHYLFWGAGVLFTPVILYSTEAASIVAKMTGYQVPLPGEEVVTGIIVGLTVLNLLSLLFFAIRKTISYQRLALELLAYGVLIALFFTNSLLLGFTVYFVFWHSLSSAHDQLHFFRSRLSPASRKQLYGEIGLVVLGALIFCLVVWLGNGPEAALRPGIVGGVFVFISLLTLPHMLLVEKLYTSRAPKAEKTIRQNHLSMLNEV